MMDYLPERGYKRIFVIIGYASISVIAVYLFLKYLLAPLLPFILAWITAMLIRPLILKISDRTGIPRKVTSFICVALVLGLIFTVISFTISRAIRELRDISDNILSDAADAVGDLFDYADNITDKLPFSHGDTDSDTEEKLKNAVTGMIEDTVRSVSSGIPDAVMNFVSSLPGIILFTVVLVVSTFYLGNDVGKINAMIASLFPEKSRERLFTAKKKLLDAGIKYVRAYLIILFITFIQLYVGFLCLRIPYALTLAAVIAFIDILPVLGVGTVLIPWSVLQLIRGNTYLGIGLLIVFGVIWVIRQIAEPRIVGQSTGLPPLVTLVTMYAGISFMGFAGIFVFPLAAILIKNLYDIGFFSRKENDQAEMIDKQKGL